MGEDSIEVFQGSIQRRLNLREVPRRLLPGQNPKISLPQGHHHTQHVVHLLIKGRHQGVHPLGGLSQRGGDLLHVDPHVNAPRCGVGQHPLLLRLRCHPQTNVLQLNHKPKDAAVFGAPYTVTHDLHQASPVGLHHCDHIRRIITGTSP